MNTKKLMPQALQLVNRPTSLNVLAQLSEEASDIQELSEESLSQVCGGAVEQKGPYIVYCIQPD